MTSSPSDGAFERLARPVQKWVHAQGWTGLQDAQARAVEPILAGKHDVLVTASTAGGKTEAAFLPILSALVESRERGDKPNGVEVLAISPLKALINDQTSRLEEMCADLDVPVHAWHGDVTASRKKKVWRDRAGVLFITPESVEGMLCLRGESVKSLLGALRYVLVDELHAFPGSARGAQLASLLHRLDLLSRRRVPRIGLSATMGDLTIGAEFLRPGRGDRVEVIEGADQQRARVTVLRGHISNRETGGLSAVAHRVYRTLRGSTNLVFANTRREVEQYADRLRQECERVRVPNEFFAHHGSLAKAEREDVEDRLELGTRHGDLHVDVGDGHQHRAGRGGRANPLPPVGCCSAPAVGTLGSSARRAVRAADLRQRGDPDPGHGTARGDTGGPDPGRRDARAGARARLVRAARDRRAPPVDPGPAGALADRAARRRPSASGRVGAVLATGRAKRREKDRRPLRRRCADTFARLLTTMHHTDLLMSASDGLLLPAKRGEREIENWAFLAAFRVPEVFRVLEQGREIGSIDAGSALAPGSGLVLAGRRWRVIAVDENVGEVEVVADVAGTAPRFPVTGSARVHDRVREDAVALPRRRRPALPRRTRQDPAGRGSLDDRRA